MRQAKKPFFWEGNCVRMLCLIKESFEMCLYAWQKYTQKI